MVAIMLIAGLFGILFLSTLLRGWVLSVMWAWFLVPLGVPAIGPAWAIGIAAIVSMLAQSPQTRKETDEEEATRLAKSFAFLFLVPLLSLLIGWLAHMGMPA